MENIQFEIDRIGDKKSYIILPLIILWLKI